MTSVRSPRMKNDDLRLNVAGKNVPQLRRARKPPLTQDQLAAKLQVLGWDIDRFGVSKIERGERQITDKQLLLLAKALSVKVTDLLQ